MDVFSKIPLLDKTFEILVEGLTLESPMALVIMERTIVLRSGTGMIMLLRFRTLHSVLTLDDFENVMYRELQRGEAIITR